MIRPRWCLPSVAMLLLCTSSYAADRWHHPLCLDGGGWWQKRIAVRIANEGPAALSGLPVTLSVGTRPGDLPLAGQRAESLRVCDARGTEMLFAVYGPDGAAVPEGALRAGSTLVIPVECPPQAAAVYYVYCDNPRAGRVPDFLAARGGLHNGDVELGSGDTPDGWRHDPADDQHRASWSSEHPQSGRRCLKTVVAAGAEPSWIATRKATSPSWAAGDIACRPGSKPTTSAASAAGTCTSGTTSSRC